ncbi:hypothetical protein [Halarcobacter sp.]|uniref:hypothetical protein n=1 Tax=Halarcobacter sp. TaxID=2321133 RepID=UPI002AA81EDC|nr:hypothetical protein [Halarcobacter sp.]
MKFFKFLILTFLLTLNLNAKMTINIGMYYDRLFINDKNISEVGARLWEKYINKEYPDIKLSIKFYKDERALLKDYKDKKLSAILSNDLFYLENKKYINDYSDKKWIVSRSSEKFEELYLIKNQKSKFTLNNLETQEVLYIDKYAKIWFESLIDLESINNISSKIKKVNKPKKLFYEPFFKENSISIMSKSMYDTMIELNPQIKEKVEIITKSEKIFFLGMGFKRKNMDKKISEIANKLISNINKTGDNSETTNYIQIQNVSEVEEHDLDKLELFYKNFLDKNIKNK